MFGFHTVKSWWTGNTDGLFGCDPRDVERMAADLCLSSSELQLAASVGPERRELLLGMMAARGIEPSELGAHHPQIMRSVEVSCASCRHAARCRRELAQHTAAENAAEFCVNAQTFDELTRQPA